MLWFLMLLMAPTSVWSFQTLCDKATSLTATNISDHAADLSWETSSPGLEAIVEVRNAGRTPELMWKASSATGLVSVNGLVAGSKYKFRVRTLCPDGSTSGSTSWTKFETTGMGPDEACPKASDLLVMDLSDDAALLSWTGDLYSDHFEVEVRSKGSTPTYFFERSVRSNMVRIGGLTRGGKYQFRVRTICVNGAASGSTSWTKFQTLEDTTEMPECDPPTDLTIDSFSTEMASISWSGSAAGYEVSLSGEDSTTTDSIWTTTDLSVSLQGLSPGTSYTFMVKALCEVGSSDPIFINFMTEDVEEVSCPEPVNLVVDEITDSSAVASWESSLDSASFSLRIESESDTLVDDSTYIVNATSFTLEGLRVGNEYTIFVAAICDTLQSDEVNIGFTIEAGEIMDTCATPFNLSAADMDSLYQLSWMASALADSFALEISSLDSATGTEVDTILTENVYLFAPMVDSILYQFRVRAFCDSLDASDFSDWMLFPTVVDSVVVCDPATDLMLKSMTPTSAYISWSGPDSVDYRVQIAASSSQYGLIVEGGVPDSLEIRNLTQGETYQISIQTLCQDEESAFTAPLVFTLGEEMVACDTPANLAATILTDSSAQLSWSGPDSATYMIEVSSTDTSSLASLNLESETMSIIVSGLNMLENYQFRVQSVCDSTEMSPFSDWFEFITTVVDTPEVMCEAPEDLILDTAGTYSATISWEEAEEAQSYEVMLSKIDSSGSMDLLSLTTGNITVTFDSLTAASMYEVRVKSICDAENDSEYSEILAFSTLEAEDTMGVECMPPTLITLDSVDATNAWITWTEIDTPQYRVGIDTPQYRVTVSATDTGIDYEFDEIVLEPMIHLDNLAVNQTYALMIQSICAAGDTSAFSEPFIFQTLDSMVVEMDSCATPEASLVTVDDTTAVVSWTPSSEDAIYLIEVEHIGFTPEYRLVATTYDLGYFIEGLSPGGLYQWKVTAFCGTDAYSDCTPWMLFETTEESSAGCGAPAGLAATNLTGTSGTLVWNGNEGDIDYEVEVESLDTTPFYSTSNLVLSSSMDIEGLTPGGVYQFKVNAKCASGQISEDSDWFIFTATPNGIQADAGSQQTAMAFPNPVVETMRVKMPAEITDQVVIELSDLSGRLVLQDRRPSVLKEELLQFKVGNLREGVYQLQVKSLTDTYHQLVYIQGQ